MSQELLLLTNSDSPTSHLPKQRINRPSFSPKSSSVRETVGPDRASHDEWSLHFGGTNSAPFPGRFRWHLGDVFLNKPSTGHVKSLETKNLRFQCSDQRLPQFPAMRSKWCRKCLQRSWFWGKRWEITKIRCIIYIYIYVICTVYSFCLHALSPRIMVPSKMTVYLKDAATIGWSHFSLPSEEAENYGAREGANPGTFRAVLWKCCKIQSSSQ